MQQYMLLIVTNSMVANDVITTADVLIKNLTAVQKTW
jgi:hypothetical protein